MRSPSSSSSQHGIVFILHSAFHVSLLKPFSPSVPGTEEPAAPSPPEVKAEPSIYRVQDILDSRRWAGHLEYLIDWEGYGLEERSWVARDDVLDPSILAEFHQNHPDRPAPRGRGWPRHSHCCLEEGVLSGNHSHHQRHSPDHNHLITEHRHLSPLIKSTINALLSSRHCLVSNIVCFTYLTHLPFVYLLVVPVFQSPFSTGFHRSCAPPSPCSIVPTGYPGKGKRTCYAQIRFHWTLPFPAHSPELSTLLHSTASDQ